MADFATTASSVAGLLAAVAAFIAILEMRRQRRSGYRPDLVVNDLDLNFTARGWRIPEVSPRPTAGREDDPPGPTLSLECLNIGVGPAKRVAVAWHFDSKSFLDSIASLHQPNGPYAFIQPKDTLRISVPDTWEAVHSLTAQLKAEVPYLLPASIRTEPYQLRLPPVYIHLLSLAVHLASARPISADPHVDFAFPEIPPLALSLDFHDLEEDAHTARFQVSTHFTMFSRGVQKTEDEGTLVANAILRVARLKSAGRMRPAAEPQARSGRKPHTARFRR